MRSFRQIIFSVKARALKVELNALTILFPLIYMIVLSFMGTNHYHYLMPLVPLLALNIARVNLITEKSTFKLEANFAGVMFVLYLLGACALYFKRDEMLGASFYAGFFAVILSSILCFYVFCGRVFYWRNISPLALILALLMAQYLTIFSLSASGIIWSTIGAKGLAGSVNRECKSGIYLWAS